MNHTRATRGRIALLAAGIFMAASGAAVAQVSRAVADGTPEIDAAIAQRNWQSALEQLDARITTNRRDVQAKFKRANALAQLGRDDDAIAAYTELTQDYPELPEPYNNLAALQAKHGHYDEARATLEIAVRANPSYALAYSNLGDLYLRLASSAYQRAATLDGDAHARQRIAQVEHIVTAPKAAAASRANGTGADAATAASAPGAPSSPPTVPTEGGTMAVFPQQPYVAPSSR
jgi:tetratricopeptide (TPR) repeat protein